MTKDIEKPIRVFWSELSQRFYASNKYRIKGDVAIITGKKTDVTDDIAHAIMKHEIQFRPKREAK